jgi:predicted membrane-bound mannosyltransferase
MRLGVLTLVGVLLAFRRFSNRDVHFLAISANVAEAVVRNRNNERLYFSASAGTFWTSLVARHAASNGVYKFTGTAALSSL